MKVAKITKLLDDGGRMDGSNKERLTFFSDPDSDQWMGQTRACADNDWSPDGKSIVVYTLFDHTNQHGEVLRIDLQD